MESPKKKLGVITSVDSDISQVGMYSMSNDAEFIWYGEILAGPKIGAYLTINQNEIKINLGARGFQWRNQKYSG